MCIYWKTTVCKAQYLVPEGIQTLISCFCAYIVILEFDSASIAKNKSFEFLKTMEEIYSSDQPYHEAFNALQG